MVGIGRTRFSLLDLPEYIPAPRYNLQAKGCLICMMHTHHEHTDLVMKVYACYTCTLTLLPFLDPRMHKSVLRSGRCMCIICAVQQEEEMIVRRLRMCTVCLVACQSKIRESAVPDPKVSFLQQFDNSLGDVSVVVKGSDEQIPAHRFILASKSPVFRAMMEIEMKEKLTGTVQIEGMSVAVVRDAVKFFYTGEIKFSDQVLPEDVLSFAHQYDIPWLKDLCEIELVQRVSTQNFLGMLEISYLYGTELLKDKVRKSFTKIEFNDKVIPEDVLSFAQKYNIGWLTDLCEVELVKKVTTQNLSEMLSICYRFPTALLEDKVTRCSFDHPVCKNFLDSSHWCDTVKRYILVEKS